ncbi:unnamed protein product, partial [Mesocestoides corti]|uniref:Uncharacterized protein n=1 Tax=Mesocestoides corti TaxID=53468 RepID=A0A0R3U9J0_MESCO
MESEGGQNERTSTTESTPSCSAVTVNDSCSNETTNTLETDKAMNEVTSKIEDTASWSDSTIRVIVTVGFALARVLTEFTLSIREEYLRNIRSLAEMGHDSGLCSDLDNARLDLSIRRESLATPTVGQQLQHDAQRQVPQAAIQANTFDSNTNPLMQSPRQQQVHLGEPPLAHVHDAKTQPMEISAANGSVDTSVKRERSKEARGVF